jgi:hypothetical protein
MVAKFIEQTDLPCLRLPNNFGDYTAINTVRHGQ